METEPHPFVLQSPFTPSPHKKFFADLHGTPQLCGVQRFGISELSVANPFAIKIENPSNSWLFKLHLKI